MPRLLTADEVADLLPVTRSWVYAQAREERIPYVRLGRYVRFEQQAVEEWITTQRRGPVPPSPRPPAEPPR